MVDAHRVIDGVDDVLRSDRMIRRIGADLVAGTVDLAASNAAAGQERGLAVRPMVAARLRGAAASRARITQFRRAPHFARDHNQRRVQQLARVQVIEQRGKRLVELRQQVILEAGKILPMRTGSSLKTSLLTGNRGNGKALIQQRRLEAASGVCGDDPDKQDKTQPASKDESLVMISVC